MRDNLHGGSNHLIEIQDILNAREAPLINPNSMLLLGHPTGNSFCRYAAKAFHEAGWLQEFHSCICWDPNNGFARWLPQSITEQLGRRAFQEVPLELQHSHPWRELARLVPPRWPLLQQHETGPLSVDGVFRSFDRRIAQRLGQLVGLQGVYLYEDAALFSFRKAEKLGVERIYDLPIGHWRAARQIFAEERELMPEWAPTLTGLKDSPAKLARKDEELALASLVVVPSTYVRTTLINSGIDEARIRVVPFGSPPPTRIDIDYSSNKDRPLRVLYVGSLGQRKGLAYALEAISTLGSKVSLTLIGRPTAKDCMPLMKALEQHEWIPSLPHHQILEQMRRHDVLLFPTLFDGFGLVMTEALSQGLPVITTSHSGAAECIRNGVEGFVVPIRNSQAIAERLQQLADDRDLLARMREASLRRASELSWQSYEQQMRMAVGEQINAGSHAV
jgi:glycosyltransferase involved in cell wall biosynthesis